MKKLLSFMFVIIMIVMLMGVSVNAETVDYTLDKLEVTNIFLGGNSNLQIDIDDHIEKRINEDVTGLWINEPISINVIDDLSKLVIKNGPHNKITLFTQDTSIIEGKNIFEFEKYIEKHGKKVLIIKGYYEITKTTTEIEPSPSISAEPSIDPSPSISVEPSIEPTPSISIEPSVEPSIEPTPSISVLEPTPETTPGQLISEKIPEENKIVLAGEQLPKTGETPPIVFMILGIMIFFAGSVILGKLTLFKKH